MSKTSPTRPGCDSCDSERRSLFVLAAGSALFALGLAARPASAATAPACFDLAKLPMGDRGMRTSLGFKMQSPDAAKTCRVCAFYTPVEGDCGKCQIFSNGPTTAASTCNSWAKKQ